MGVLVKGLLPSLRQGRLSLPFHVPLSLQVLADVLQERFCHSLADIRPVFRAQACIDDVCSGILAEVRAYVQIICENL